MELIDQHTKKIMEGCKERARSAGLRFETETLEYIVTNRDLLELSPKSMIPNLYDYWVHEVEVLKEKGRYELYPTNPYETVINTRPVISFYNDNNPDWLNVMIFYHVLAHIDFFQNNRFFEHTWDEDFNGEALADKRFIARLRSAYGRWVDYVIEFSRGMDNLVDYFHELNRINQQPKTLQEEKIDYYFDVFVQDELSWKQSEYIKEIERYNQHVHNHGDLGGQTFLTDVNKQYPEFEDKFRVWREKAGSRVSKDLIQFIADHSEFVNRHENRWMRSVLEIVRKTSLFFQPQIRTKIMNEGWATFWHERLFLQDERIGGHEVDFSKAHSQVASLSRVGLNPYALGVRLFQEIEEWADKGRYSYEFEKIANARSRNTFSRKGQSGIDCVFAVRQNLSDSMFIRSFITQDFVDRHRLFVAGKRLNKAKRSWEYSVISRKAEDYKAMLLKNLYHPPRISYSVGDTGVLQLSHQFEGRPLVTDYIANTMLGIEYLWGHPVTLDTHEVREVRKPPEEGGEPEVTWDQVRYTMHSKQLTRETIPS